MVKQVYMYVDSQTTGGRWLRQINARRNGILGRGGIRLSFVIKLCSVLNTCFSDLNVQSKSLRYLLNYLSLSEQLLLFQACYS